MSVQTDTYWTVSCGDQIVGTLVPGPPRDDFHFWEWGTFTPGPAYEAAKSLLAEEFRDRWNTEDDEGRYRFWRELERRDIRLQRHPDGKIFTAFSLHIDGSIAWWIV